MRKPGSPGFFCRLLSIVCVIAAVFSLWCAGPALADDESPADETEQIVVKQGRGTPAGMEAALNAADAQQTEPAADGPAAVPDDSCSLAEKAIWMRESLSSA